MALAAAIWNTIETLDLASVETLGNRQRARVTSIEFASGGYRFIPGVFQYSAGVAALPGFRIERIKLQHPLLLSDGFRLIEQVISAAGRPLTSFCACELRSPAPFSEASFRDFNEDYVGVLSRWGIVAGGANPVARSNVCPVLSPPAEPSLYAFCFTTTAVDAPPSFVISGSGEVPEGKANYRDHIIRPGDCSPVGLKEKARFVLGEMEARLAALGFQWRETTATQVYTIHDLHPFLADEIVQARCRIARLDVALRPPAHRWPRIRDGLSRRSFGAGPRRLTRFRLGNGPSSLEKP